MGIDKFRRKVVAPSFQGDQVAATDGASTGSIKQKKVTLTAAQVKALHATPVALLAAPGAGQYNDVISVTGHLAYSTAQFTGANNVELRYTDGSGDKVTGDLAYAWLNAASSGAAKAIQAAVTPVANAAVVAAVPVADPGGSTAAGTVTFDIYYRVLTLP